MFDTNHHFYPLDPRLDRVQHLLENIVATMQDLTAKVAECVKVEEGAITLINGLSQQLKDAMAQNNPQAIQTVIDQLDAEKAKLAAAIGSNTPTPPAPNP